MFVCVFRIAISILTIFCLQLPLSAFSNSKLENSQSYAASKDPAVQQQQRDAEEELNKSIIHNAKAALEETKKAIDALGGSGDERQACQAIEQATGKLDMLLAVHPETSLLPVGYRVALIDAAPKDVQAIKRKSAALENQVWGKNYIECRSLLESLRSEITVRVDYLPLAVYPEFLKEAARLLKEKKSQQAKERLEMGLHTIASAVFVLSIPLIKAKQFVDQAIDVSQSDCNKALELMNNAKQEIELARELGYINKEEYSSMEKEVGTIEKQLKRNKCDRSIFESLKNTLKKFLDVMERKFAFK